MREEKFFNAVFEGIRHPFLIVDVNTYEILYANSAAGEKEKIIGKPCYEGFHNLKKPCSREKCPISQVEQTGESTRTEHSHLYPGGEERLCEVHGFPIRENGKIKKMIMCFFDVTGRKEVEAELNSSENYNRSIIEALPDIVMKVDREGIFLDIRSSSENKLFKPKEELLGKKISDVMPSKTAGNVMDCLRKTLKNKELSSVEYELKVPEGNLLFEARMVPFDEDTVIALIRDITAKKSAEEKIKKSEERLKRITENMTDVVFTADLNLNVNFISPSIERLTGRKYRECKKSKLSELITPLSLKKIKRALQLELKREKSPNVDKNRSRITEAQFLKKDGSLADAEMNSRFLRDKNGTPVGIVGAVRDITGRKVQQRFNSLAADVSREFIDVSINNIDEKINMLLERCSRFLKVDRGYLFLYSKDRSRMSNTHEWCREGVSSQKKVIRDFPVKQLPWWNKMIKSGDFVKIDDIDELPGDAVAEKKEFKRQNIKSLVGFPVRNKDGGLIGFMGYDSVSSKRNWRTGQIVLLRVFANIISKAYEKVSIEEQMRQIKKMESIGQLAGGIAHDYNNMLTAIISNTELALESVEHSSAVYGDLLEIHRAAKRSADLTAQLLAFAKKQVRNPKMLDLNKSIQEMLKMLELLIGEDIKINFIPGKGVEKIMIDPSQLNQIIINLSLNSRDAISGSGVINIETSGGRFFDGEELQRSLGGKKYVKLSFGDNGCGISKEVLSHIFEPYFSRKKGGGNTGMGLATVYGIVKQNGGYIDVHSSPGEGSAFEIFFPVNSKDADMSEPKKKEVRTLSGNETILLVEDEKAIVKSLKRTLEKYGYRVLTSLSAAGAVKVAKEYGREIDLLITDVVMPGMNGKELCGRISEIVPGIKSLYISGHTDNVIHKQGIIKKDINFLHKPFSSEVLARKIRQVLEE